MPTSHSRFERVVSALTRQSRNSSGVSQVLKGLPKRQLYQTLAQVLDRDIKETVATQSNGYTRFVSNSGR